MFRAFLSCAGTILLLFPSVAAGSGTADVATWQPATGDTFVVDVASNTGYLVHANGEQLSFPVATGRKGYVSYIGRHYKAETPIRTWTAEQAEIKGDRRTFGVSGRFIRLFRNGENSPYGIHSYYKEKEWMNADGRYFSMGCIIVTEEMMDMLQKTFTTNQEKMMVITTNSADEEIVRMTNRDVAVK